MLLSDFAFELPKELIAQKPLAERSDSRMLVVERAERKYFDREFSQFPEILRKGDLIVVNNTRVFPARLFGRSETGARIELFLIEETAKGTWKTLVRPGKRVKPGKMLSFNDLTAEVLEKSENGQVIVRFNNDATFDQAVDAIGHTPLPPYIKRDADLPDLDRDRYQTIFARERGAIAAPTAGLHFSEATFKELAANGIEVGQITLHVGYGTFEPVRETDLSSHRVAPERFEIAQEEAEKLEKARRENRRIVAVGTTTTRTLEYVLTAHGSFKALAGRADLTIVPGYKFAAVKALLTNFHLPESSLLILVATFGGHQLIMDAYRHAVRSRYRFYSYGDCMFVE
jgi:S-adenosylmethionine:tRNA ribosyltransferase-isomerase